jgi:hypothetical protein
MIGSSVSIDSNISLIGLIGNNSSTSQQSRGYVLIIEKSTSLNEWMISSYLNTNLLESNGISSIGSIGRSVSIDNGIALIGMICDDISMTSCSRGRSFILSKSTNTSMNSNNDSSFYNNHNIPLMNGWMIEGSLMNPDTRENDLYGYRVSNRNGMMIVSSLNFKIYGENETIGSVYIYKRESMNNNNNTNNISISFLMQSSPSSNELDRNSSFGMSLMISNGIALIGCPSSDSITNIDTGGFVLIGGWNDFDFDGIDIDGNECDNCPLISNDDQSDIDFDGIGDLCDPCMIDPTTNDIDNDGFIDGCDNCPNDFNPNQEIFVCNPCILRSK